ncbi:MAG: CbtA family protein [Betaproteobacteria bacterium]
MFARIVAAAALAGLLAGLLLSALQQVAIAPLILAAEVREDAARAAGNLPHADPDTDHAHAWTPAGPRQRLAATAAANIAVATGFALLLAALMSLRDASGWRAGLAYGAAGYAVVFVAPALGLPPELPGSASAPLQVREVWWIATVIASAAGLGLIAFTRKPALRAAGIMLLLAPHAVGAPQPAAHDALHPAAAVTDFIRATYLVNGALWLALGGLVGYCRRARR